MIVIRPSGPCSMSGIFHLVGPLALVVKSGGLGPLQPHSPRASTARPRRWLSRVPSHAISIAGISPLFLHCARHRRIGIRIALWQIHAAYRRVFSRRCSLSARHRPRRVIWFYVIVYQLGGGNRVPLLAATAVGLMVAGLVACGVPVRHALRIQPTEALRHAG